jgi:cobalt-zinc-cadmium efflux system membrane fusion protein
MKFNAFFTFLHSKYFKLSKEEKIFTQFVIIFLLVIFIKNIFNFFENIYHKQPEEQLIRQNNQLIIPSSSPIRKHLKTQTLKPSKRIQVITVPGFAETNPKRDIDINSPLPGRLIKIPVKLGDWVEKNQVLAIINSPELAQLYSTQEAAIAQLTLTERLLERALKVNLAGANSKKDVEIAINNKAAAQANLKSIQEKIKIFGHNKYSLIFIRAPSPGYITNIHLGKGSYINDPTKSIMTINNIDNIWITANIPEYLISKLTPKQPVRFTIVSEPKKVYSGHISFIAPRMDELTRTNKTRISILNPDGKIKPNMFATIKLLIPEYNKIILPTSAIFMDYESTSVFIEVAPWVFQRKIVEIGFEQNNQVEILSGLKIGDKVATEGGVFIND